MTSPLVSPALSRTPSALFSPTSPHRRSHPNLQHLSLAPLTPKYPISTADYDAYYDPATSDLHTSTSLSHIATLPSPGGILSKPGSRSASRTRRKNKSVHIQTDLPSGALTSEGFGATQIKKTKSRLRLQTNTADEGWITQTALSLTEGTRESKGQLWIAKRDSSTSLHSPETRTALRSGINTPNPSRRGSRARLSKRNLKMTPALTPGEDVRPQWVEEAAVELENEVQDELDAEDDEYFRDRYGMVDFTGHFDSDDEEEVRDALRKRGFIMGRWIDGVIDSLMMLEPEPDLEIDQDTKSTLSKEDTSMSGDSIEEPPEKPRSVWDDVRWFGRVVGRTFSS